MSAPHNSQHDDVLERVLAEDLDRESPEVAEMLSQCEVCREKLRALDSLAGDLNSFADLQAEVLNEAATLENTPGEDRVVAMMSPRPNVMRFVALAAAIVIGASVWWSLTDLGSPALPDAEYYLDAHETYALSPYGPSQDFASFSWEIDLPAGGHHRVVIWQLDEKNQAEPRLTSENLTQASWTLTDQEQRDLPDRIYWEVQTYDAFGSVERVGTFASR